MNWISLRPRVKPTSSLLGLAIGILSCMTAGSSSAQAAPTLSINDVTISEGDTDSFGASFTVTLSEPSNGSLTVEYASADNTAIAGSDYTAASGTLTFAPGETSKTVTVPVTGDSTFENDETFFVNLSNATGAPLGDAQGLGNILNDDSAPKGLVTSLADDGSANTLRAEIARAMSGDTITFQPGLTGTITLTQGELLVQKNLTIQGLGANIITISANKMGRVFRFKPPTGTPTITTTVSGLTITGGVSSSGAGIFNDSSSTLTVEGCVLTGNAASSGNGYGAGIYNAGVVNVNSSVLSNNIASVPSGPGYGGAIYNYFGTVTLNSSTLSNNSASSASSSNGGGVYLSSGTLTINNSTVSGNSAASTGGYPSYGGGVYQSGGQVVVSNSTICNNVSGTGGGLFQNGGILSMGNSTVAGNSASTGGGISNSNGNATMFNTIVAGNIATSTSTSSATSPDIKGTIGSGDYNLVQNISGTNLAGTHNITGVSPKLSGLTDNGGSTLTMAPYTGSLAIDAGDPAFDSTVTPNDQRGVGSPRVRGGRIDIGAIESSTAGSSSKGVVTSLADDGLAGTLRAEIARAIPGDIITFQSGLTGTIVLSSGELLIQKNLTIQGPGANRVTVRSGNSHRVSGSRRHWPTQLSRQLFLA